MCCYAGSILDEERRMVVRRHDVGDPDVRSRDAAVFSDGRRGGRQLRAMVQRLRRRLVQARRTSSRAGATGAVSTGDLRPAARVLAARRGTKTDVPRGSHVPATQELRL